VRLRGGKSESHRTHANATCPRPVLGIPVGRPDLRNPRHYRRVSGIRRIRCATDSLLQGIAAGLLGRGAFAGGLLTAFLGLLCHFFIAFSAAAVYVLSSRGLAVLARRPTIAGPLYGIVVYFFMQLAVLPLSGAIKRPFSLEMTIIGVIIHIFCVGLPIALATRHFAPR
jgi:hypothetical protein